MPHLFIAISLLALTGADAVWVSGGSPLSILTGDTMGIDRGLPANNKKKG